MSPEVAKWCYRGIVRYLNGDINLFLTYVDKAKQIYEEEERKMHLYIPLYELIPTHIIREMKRRYGGVF